MPAVLRELHGVVPSYANQFFWSDDHHQVSNFYDENAEGYAQASLYMNEFLNKSECEVQAGFSQAMRSEYGVKTLEEFSKVDLKRWYRHDAYQLLLRPLKYHQIMRTVVREQQRALGFLYVMRTDNEAKFTERDKKKVDSLLPYIAHALASKDVSTPLADSEEEGLIIAGATGRIQYSSPQANKLILLSTHAQVSMHNPARRLTEIVLPPPVVQICKNLTALFEGKSGNAAPPVWKHRNAWGGFVYRAHRMQHNGNVAHATLNDNVSAPLIGVTVQRQEPLPLKLMRSLRDLPLSAKQMQLCLLMAAGYSYAEIGARMDISEQTVIYHSRQLYTKLDVHSRTELMNKLLAL